MCRKQRSKTRRVCVRFLQRAWRPQGIATTIYAGCSFCLYSVTTARVVMQKSHAHPDKDMVSMRILGHGTLVVGRDTGARGFPDRRTHGVATRPKPQPYV